MDIRLNGEKRACEGEVTVLDLLSSLGLKPGAVVVEINRRIVPRERFAEEKIGEGDEVEMVRLVGGG